jgi:pyruvate dehydrogenase E1 component alpha subunit
MTETRPEPATLEQMYRLMLLTTAAGERARAEVTAGRMQAAFYPVRGLEGVCAALGAAFQPSDKLVSTYRNLGDALAKGASLRAIIAELLGRVDGTSGGLGGPMHLHDQQAGFVTSTGIVGAGLPIAVGVAMAAQLEGAGRAVVTTHGDGATSIGAFHEAMNMAALWQLPLVVVCQNNGWGEHTPLAEYAANTDLAARAASYNMRAETVDGFDPIATWRVLDGALQRARAGEGPTFVECRTYRLTGHSGTADASYMPADELAAAMARDPAPTFRGWLLAEDVLDEARLAAIEADVEAAVTDAFDFGFASASPSEDDLYAHVFADRSAVPTYSR